LGRLRSSLYRIPVSSYTLLWYRAISNAWRSNRLHAIYLYAAQYLALVVWMQHLSHDRIDVLQSLVEIWYCCSLMPPLPTARWPGCIGSATTVCTAIACCRCARACTCWFGSAFCLFDCVLPQQCLDPIVRSSNQYRHLAT
jgi:hypothetical protein